MSYAQERAYSQITRTPAGEKRVGGELYAYDVRMIIETCGREYIRLIVLENGQLVLTRRFLIVGEQKQAVRSAQLMAENYFRREEGRLAEANQQQPLLAKVG